MKIIKGFLLLTIALASSLAFADSSDVGARAALVGSIYKLVTFFGMFMGVGLMTVGVIKLKRRAENPNDTKTFPTAIVITLLAGAAAFNYAGSASLFIKSFLGDEGNYCFVVTEGDYNKQDNGFNTGCWNPDNSDILKEVADKVNQMSGSDAGTVLKENAKVIFAIFQTIGLMYFLKGLYELKLVSEGASRDGYGKPIITLIASSLIIDLPHTLDMIRVTINSLGFGV